MEKICALNKFLRVELSVEVIDLDILNNMDLFEKEKLSLWLADGISTDYPKLEKNENCDICVVGAGITGITTAFLLSDKHDVVLIDRHAPLHLTTGNTTAKLTFQHSLNYYDMMERYGKREARLYYEAQVQGMQLVKMLVEDYNIDCDFKEVPAMVFAETEEKFDEIIRESVVYDKLGIQYELLTSLPYGIEGVGGIKVFNQFQLDPVKYLDALLQMMNGRVRIFQDTTASDISENTCGVYEVSTKYNLNITCDKVVVATGYPFLDKSGSYFSKLTPYRSYLVAFPIDEMIDEDMMLISNSDPTYSIRFAHKDNQKYLLVGGGGHRVGEDRLSYASYREIIDYGKKHFDVVSPTFRWSSQDYVSLDNVPYIGQISDKYENVFVATGFKKWGMSNGSFAAILINDLVEGKSSIYSEVFSPQRKDIQKNLGDFVKSTYGIAREMIKGKVFQKKDELNQISRDTGGIIVYKGKKVGAYKDNSGNLFLVDTTCTHMGCDLEYNKAEKTFDCPCHGSRFNYDGTVIEGPAIKNLKQIKE